MKKKGGGGGGDDSRKRPKHIRGNDDEYKEEIKREPSVVVAGKFIDNDELKLYERLKATCRSVQVVEEMSREDLQDWARLLHRFKIVQMSAEQVDLIGL